MEKTKIEMEKEIEDLKEKLAVEKAVKESEVLLNGEFKEHNKKLQLFIETQGKIIQDFATKISRLQEVIRKLTS